MRPREANASIQSGVRVEAVRDASRNLAVIRVDGSVSSVTGFTRNRGCIDDLAL